MFPFKNDKKKLGDPKKTNALYQEIPLSDQRMGHVHVAVFPVGQAGLSLLHATKPQLWGPADLAELSTFALDALLGWAENLFTGGLASQRGSTTHVLKQVQ